MNGTFDSPRLRNLKPYTPGEQPVVGGVVKLNTNENPYPPSPLAVAAMLEAVRSGLELYPDPDAGLVRESIAAYYGLSDAEVFVGNGSDEVLAFAFCAFFQQEGRPLLFPDVTYSFYEVYCQLYGIIHKLVPVDGSLRITVEDFLALQNSDTRIAGIVLANPNAPTGEHLSLAEIERLLFAYPYAVVLVDEAYVDFGGQSAAHLVRQHPNLLVVQTLSKSRSLAGLRVGFAVGSEQLISSLRRVKDSFNSYPVGRVAQAGAAAAIRDRLYFAKVTAAVMSSRDSLSAALKSQGFEVLPSKANFLFVRHPTIGAERLARNLLQYKILVRHFRRPRVDQFLRISIGTDQQMAYLIEALRKIMTGSPKP